MDKNGDAQQNEDEGPYSQAKLFLDQNGNFNLDENETSFAPDSNGSFLLPFHLASIHSASHQTTQMRMSLFRLRKKGISHMGGL